MDHDILGEILLLLAASVVVIAAFRRLKLPPILAYLLVGIAVGPHALGWFDNSHAAELLGEVGIAFLLFAIGLEFSIPQFWSMRRVLLGLGGVQVLVGTVAGGLIAWSLGISWQSAVVVGGALAMSSTAIVVKQLTEQVELQSPHGRLALGILLFQDLAAVPFLVMIPILAAGELTTIGPSLAYAMLKGIGAFAVMLALGRWVLRPLFHEVAASRSPELFTLTVLLVSLLAAWITSLLGLSLALGAFLAGMMLSETEFRHQIETDIRPFRDVLLGLFFVTVGMRLDPMLLPPMWQWIVLLVGGLILGKGLLIFLLTRLSGGSGPNAIRTALVLAHGGEFGFALLALALGTGLLSSADSQPILAAVVLSMLVAPLLIRHSGALAQWWIPEAGTDDELARDIATDTSRTRDHVILCGFGRVGQLIASRLHDRGMDWVALDLDPLRIKSAWEDGDKVFYGDTSHREILEAAGLQRARALVISFADVEYAMKTLKSARSIDQSLPILVRSPDESRLDQLFQAGASDIVPETLEASLALVTRLFKLLDKFPRGQV